MLRNIVTGIVAVAGTFIALTFWHMYNDHVLIHAVVQAISQPRPNQPNQTQPVQPK